MAKYLIWYTILCCSILQSKSMEEDPFPADDEGNYKFLTDDYEYTILHHTALDWHKALDSCKELGGVLATLDSQKKLIRLHEFLIYKNFHQTSLSPVSPPFIYWSSGNDLKQPGTFVWETNGKEFAYAHWLNGKPETIEGGGCVQFGEKAIGRWTVRKCTDELFYVCEKKLKRPKVSQTQPPTEKSAEEPSQNKNPPTSSLGAAIN